MKHKCIHRILLPAVLLMLCLLATLVGTACTNGSGDTETTVADTTTPVNDPTDTTAPADTSDLAAETTVKETESVTEPETTVPTFDPTTFVPADLPLSNVAREGFGFGVTSRLDGIHSNVFLNDGDLSTGFATNAKADGSETEALWVFIDLMCYQTVSEVKLYPAADLPNGFPVNFDIYTSLDGEDYHLVASKDDATASAEGVTLTFPEEQARYVKLVTRKLGAGDETGKYLALGEFEVYGKVDTASNMILNRHEVWLFKDPDTTQQLTLSHFRDGSAVDANATLRWMTTNPAVAMVDENGLVTPVSYGSADIYVTDGTNLARCRVDVKEKLNTEYWITTFWVSNHVDLEHLAKAVKIVAESGVDHIEGTNSTDLYGNQTALYTVRLCHENGIVYSLRDGVFYDVKNVNDKRLISEVQKYEGLPGLYGFFVGDEPNDDSFVDLAKAVRYLHNYNPHYVYHANLLPPTNSAVPGWDAYFTEFAAIVGGTDRYEYLSFDQYPFVAGGGFDGSVWNSLNYMRQVGLKWNASTGFYVQSQVWLPHFEALTTNTRYYDATIGLAYGMKNIKHYIALTPTDPEAGAHYQSGILKPDFTPADYYDDIVAVNAYIKSMGTLLSNADAVEVYHSDATPGAETLPADFALTQRTAAPLIYSLFEEFDGSRQYVMLTNKSHTANTAMSFSLKAKDGFRDLQLFDPVTGETTDVTVGADGSFSVSILPGHAVVLILPEGADAKRPSEPSANLALGKGAFVSSSQAKFWENNQIGARFLTDGSLDSGMWRSTLNDRGAYAMIDLGEVKSVSETRLFAPSGVSSLKYDVFVSVDGKTFTKVATINDTNITDQTIPSIATFDTVDARYVRFASSATSGTMRLAEIEIYG